MPNAFADVLAAAFANCVDLRQTLLADLFSLAVPHLGTGSSLQRAYMTEGNGQDVCIQVLTAAVLFMVQGCANLPPVDASCETLGQGYAPAVATADQFWMMCLERWEVLGSSSFASFASHYGTG